MDLRLEIAKRIRQLKQSRNVIKTANSTINEIQDLIKKEKILEHFFEDLPDFYRALLPEGKCVTPGTDIMLERDAQLFEAQGMRDDIKKLHMRDPVYVFQKLDQVRDALKANIQGHFKANPNQSLEKSFWSQYSGLGCDSGFTYDNYDRLIKLMNAKGFPQTLLFLYVDTAGNQVRQGDAVTAIRDIIEIRSGNKIPLGTRLKITNLHYQRNYVEADYKGIPWVFDARQVEKN